MKAALFLLVSALLAFFSVRSLAQEINSWGTAFDCAVDWFGGCNSVQERRDDEPIKLSAVKEKASSLAETKHAANLPLPVRTVLENPSPETARAYVLWAKQARERLAKASEYIARATREVNSEAVSNEGKNDVTPSGVGPLGLYYFFSPGDTSASKDVAALNEIWREGRIGVVGIPIRGNDEEISRFVNETRPRFPVRKSDVEVKLVKPIVTPELYLAFPLEKRIFRLGSVIDEVTIVRAIHDILLVRSKRNSGFEEFATDRAESWSEP